MRQLVSQDSPAVNVPYKALKDYEDLFLEKRSGHLIEYAYSGDVDYYEKLVKEEEKYYSTNAEIVILEKHKYAIADIIGEYCNVVEIGPGPEYVSKKKVIPLLNAFRKLSSYTAIDSNIDYAVRASNIIRDVFKHLDCAAYKADFTKQIEKYSKGKTCLLFLGSTISNFTDYEIDKIFSNFYNTLNTGDYLIFAADCNEDLDSIKKAHDNSITAGLILNIVRYFKDGFMIMDFDPTKFKFEYEWNYMCRAAHGNLIATSEQKFYFNNNKIIIHANKRYHVAISRRFVQQDIDSICKRNNFSIENIFIVDGTTMMYIVRKYP